MAEAMDLEAQQLLLEREICDLSLESLKALAKHLEMVYEETDGRLKLSRNIRRKVEEIVESADDNKSEIITGLRKFIGENPPALDDKEADYAKAKQELDDLQAKFREMMELQQQLKEAGEKLISLQTNGDQPERIKASGDAGFY